MVEVRKNGSGSEARSWNWKGWVAEGCLTALKLFAAGMASGAGLEAGRAVFRSAAARRAAEELAVVTPLRKIG